MKASSGVVLGLAFACAALCVSASAQEAVHVSPDQVLSQEVSGMPTGAQQEVRVFTAAFKPGDETVFHTHRFPVTVYVLEGTFTLEMEGRDPVRVMAGHAFVEPPHVMMTGYNRSAADPLRVVVFYVSDPDTPFLDPVH